MYHKLFGDNISFSFEIKQQKYEKGFKIWYCKKGNVEDFVVKEITYIDIAF